MGEPFDRTFVDKAIQSQVTLVSEVEVITNRGITTKNLGSFLCSPIIGNDEIVAILYVANRRFSGLMGDDEIKIADYLATAAGAALEKAESFRQLRDLNQNLEATVRDRTALIVKRSTELEQTAIQLRSTQANLETAKEIAEDASRAKTVFLARMSHEIRTPIAGILGFAELLLRGSANHEQERTSHLETILSSGTHLLHLLNDVLDMSKIEADKIDIEAVSFNPSQLIGEVLKTMQSKAIQKEIFLNLEIVNAVPENIVSDPTRFRQIISNLVGNAIKFTKSGGVTVVVELKGDSKHDACLDIAIQDTGVGMTADQLTKIFEPFTQADSTITRQYGGTGLGLSISKRLAEAFGGYLNIESQQNVGTTLTFSFPIIVSEETPLISPDQARQSAARTEIRCFERVDLRGIRVLIADDSEIIRHLLTSLLTSYGSEVVTATNGQETIDVLRSKTQEVDLVLIDMQMPIVDGFTAVRQLREENFDLPIIALTANAMAGDELRCRQAGCSEYLAKPLDLNMLLKIIEGCAKANPMSERCERIHEHAPPPPELTMDACAEKKLLPADWLREFACELLDRVDRVLPSLIDACQEERLDEVSAHLHWMKGSGGTVGLENLSVLAECCDQAIKQSRTEEVAAKIDEIRLYVSQAQNERNCSVC